MSSSCSCSCSSCSSCSYTLKADIVVKNGNPIPNLLRQVFHSQLKIKCVINIWIPFQSRKYISDEKQISYILIQNGIAIPVHLKFFRVYDHFSFPSARNRAKTKSESKTSPKALQNQKLITQAKHRIMTQFGFDLGQLKDIRGPFSILHFGFLVWMWILYDLQIHNVYFKAHSNVDVPLSGECETCWTCKWWSNSDPNRDQNWVQIGSKARPKQNQIQSKPVPLL